MRLGLVALLVLLAACGDPSGTMALDAAADGSTVRLSPGDHLEVALPGNPSTGFGWIVDQIDDSVLAEIEEPRFVAESDLVGAGGTITLTFEAMADGSTPLELSYRRPFEDEPPLGTFLLTVIVGQ